MDRLAHRVARSSQSDDRRRGQVPYRLKHKILTLPSHLEAPACDAPSPAVRTRVVGVGCHAHQRTDLAPVESAQFGQLGDQRGGGHLADAGHALQHTGQRAVMLLDMAGHLGLDVVELPLDRFDHRLDAGARHGPRQPQPLTLRELHGQELAAACHERSQVLLLWLGERADEALAIGPAGQHLGELGQRRGVDPVGLGQPLHGPREVARHPRVDHRHTQARRLQRTDQCRLVAAGGLHQHQRRAQARQAICQRAVAVGVVGEPSQCARQLVADRCHIDVLGGDVDAHHHG